ELEQPRGVFAICGALPLGLAREPCALPARVGVGLEPRDPADGQIRIEPLDAIEPADHDPPAGAEAPAERRAHVRGVGPAEPAPALVRPELAALVAARVDEL